MSLVTLTSPANSCFQSGVLNQAFLIMLSLLMLKFVNFSFFRLLAFFITYGIITLKMLHVCVYVCYQVESKVLQYFCNMRHNLAAPDTFADFVKVTNHLGLGDAKLAWYSPSTTCFYNLKFSLGIFSFRTTWPSLIITALANKEKFLEPSNYCVVINCIFTLCTTNIFGCIHSIMAQFTLIMHKFAN